jgi:hypothetical protein
MRELAAASGWDWPDTDDVATTLDRLVDLSSDWDFRRRATAGAGTRAGAAPNAVERGQMPYAPAVVRGRTLAESLIRSAAAALGLVESARPPDELFTHVVVLAGGVTGCVNRARYAADLIRDGIPAGRVVALGAHRLLGSTRPPARPEAPTEREQARTLGLGELDSESAVVLAAARQAFNLPEPARTVESAPDAGTEEQRLARAACYRWENVEVVITPSAHPEKGVRANTAAQLRHWQDLAGLTPEDRVLLVTTQIYVPYQHLVGIEVLGLGRRPGPGRRADAVLHRCRLPAGDPLHPVGRPVPARGDRRRRLLDSHR